MKTFKKSSNTTVSAIHCGDVFEYEDEIYIKTDLCSKEIKTLEYIIAVSLSTGLALSFNPDEPVEALLRGHFVIGYEKEGDEND